MKKPYQKADIIFCEFLVEDVLTISMDGESKNFAPGWFTEINNSGM